MPSFRQLLTAVAEAWRDRRDDVGAPGAEASSMRSATSARIAAVDRAADGLAARRGRVARSRASFDPGARAASAAHRSSRRHRRSSSCCAAATDRALEMAVQTLDAMAAGGMYDLVGGGFHRYSVDERWLVPHFEKMLYDNALLAPAYLHAWLVTGRRASREVVEETLEYVLRELALDGRRARIGPGRRHRRRRRADLHVDEEEAAPSGWTRRCCCRSSTAADRPRRARARAARAPARGAPERPQPSRDDKAIASWNGLALAALADAGYRLERRGLARGGTRGSGVPPRTALERRRAPRRAWRDGRVSR